MEFTKEQVDGILNRINDELDAKRINRLKFYKECGISSASYSQWNTGARRPSTASIQKIASYLGLSVDYLLTGDKKYYPNEDGAEVAELRDILRDRPEAKILFQTAKNAPASAILEAAALLMRYKEESEKH